MAFLGGLFDPPASQVPLPQMQAYAPTGMGGAEGNLLGGVGNLGNFNVYGQNLPQAQQISQQLASAPGANTYAGGATGAMQMGMGGASSGFNAGTALYDTGGRIMNTAFDPQSALYARTLQQVQDQSRAGQAARGIAMTPYGAGLEDQNIRNFNIDWQNQQLQRQIAGGGAQGQLYGQAAGMQQNATQNYLGAAGLPYNVAQQIGYGQLGALGAGGQFGQQAAALPQQQIADWQNYLGWGTGQQNAFNTAQMNAYKAASDQEKQSYAENKDLWSGIGNVAGKAASMFMFSDVRVKEDIDMIGELIDGTPVYSYRYIGDNTPRLGLMAQDVERDRPDAVVEIGGVKAVDYARATARSRAMSRGMDAFSNWG